MSNFASRLDSVTVPECDAEVIAQCTHHCLVEHPAYRVTCREDLQNLPTGRKLMRNIHIASHELVARPGFWHSSAQVIEGRFRLLPSQLEFMQWVDLHGEGPGEADTFWCNKTWDPSNGQLLTYHEQPRHIRKSSSLNSRYVLA